MWNEEEDEVNAKKTSLFKKSFLIPENMIKLLLSQKDQNITTEGEKGRYHVSPLASTMLTSTDASATKKLTKDAEKKRRANIVAYISNLFPPEKRSHVLIFLEQWENNEMGTLEIDEKNHFQMSIDKEKIPGSSIRDILLYLYKVEKVFETITERLVVGKHHNIIQVPKGTVILLMFLKKLYKKNKEIFKFFKFSKSRIQLLLSPSSELTPHMKGEGEGLNPTDTEYPSSSDTDEEEPIPDIETPPQSPKPSSTSSTSHSESKEKVYVPSSTKLSADANPFGFVPSLVSESEFDFNHLRNETDETREKKPDENQHDETFTTPPQIATQNHPPLDEQVSPPLPPPPPSSSPLLPPSSSTAPPTPLLPPPPTPKVNIEEDMIIPLLDGKPPKPPKRKRKHSGGNVADDENDDIQILHSPPKTRSRTSKDRIRNQKEKKENDASALAKGAKALERVIKNKTHERKREKQYAEKVEKAREKLQKYVPLLDDDEI